MTTASSSFFTLAHTPQDEYTQALCSFLDAAPTSYHAAHHAVDFLCSHGFTQLNEEDDWSPLDAGGYVVRRGGSFVAWIMPTTTPQSFRIIGTHTDSPAFKLKPSVSSDPGAPYRHIDVELYGGMIINSWLNRECGLAGIVTTCDGTEYLVDTHRPVMIIPQLAIHLMRDQNTKLELCPQQHMHPLATDGDGEDIRELLVKETSIKASDIAGMDIYSYSTDKAACIGQTMLASARQDNLLSVHSAVCALLSLYENTFHSHLSDHAHQPHQHNSSLTPQSLHDVMLIAGFDHEEIGSHTRYGAAGSFLPDILQRITELIYCSPHSASFVRNKYSTMISSGSCLSVDVTHAFHPNYPDKHDPATQPVLGGGPALKLNANQRYSTDSYGQALWKQAALKAGIKTQTFVSRNNVTCGSTIAPMIATRLGFVTIDAGVPILSMHSAREISNPKDSHAMVQLMYAYLLSS